MEEINYSIALQEDYEVILKGDIVNKFKREVNLDTPMKFKMVNKKIHELLSDMNYIEFWDYVKIYRVV